jgi:hypothetical protein
MVKGIIIVVLLFSIFHMTAPADPVTVQVYDSRFYDPSSPELPTTQALDQLMQEDPDIRVTFSGVGYRYPAEAGGPA